VPRRFTRSKLETRNNAQYFGKHEPFRLRWLKPILVTGINQFIDSRNERGFTMSFRFGCFRDTFQCRCDDAELSDALDNGVPLRECP